MYAWRFCIHPEGEKENKGRVADRDGCRPRVKGETAGEESERHHTQIIGGNVREEIQRFMSWLITY